MIERGILHLASGLGRLTEWFNVKNVSIWRFMPLKHHETASHIDKKAYELVGGERERERELI